MDARPNHRHKAAFPNVDRTIVTYRSLGYLLSAHFVQDFLHRVTEIFKGVHEHVVIVPSHDFQFFFVHLVSDTNCYDFYVGYCLKKETKTVKLYSDSSKLRHAICSSSGGS